MEGDEPFSLCENFEAQNEITLIGNLEKISAFLGTVQIRLGHILAHSVTLTVANEWE